MAKNKKLTSRQKIARKRISELFEKAKSEDQDVAKEMMKLAFRLKQKYNVDFTKEEKIRFCKNCFNHLTDSDRRIRVSKGKMVVTCLECDAKKRFGYNKK